MARKEVALLDVLKREQKVVEKMNWLAESLGTYQAYSETIVYKHDMCQYKECNQALKEIRTEIGEYFEMLEESDEKKQYTTYSVQTEVNSWCNDEFNGTLDECKAYCREQEYQIDGESCRIALILCDSDDFVVEELNYINSYEDKF